MAQTKQFADREAELSPERKALLEKLMKIKRGQATGTTGTLGLQRPLADRHMGTFCRLQEDQATERQPGG